MYCVNFDTLTLLMHFIFQSYANKDDKMSRPISLNFLLYKYQVNMQHILTFSNCNIILFTSYTTLTH